jgi:hypothetical protein
MPRQEEVVYNDDEDDNEMEDVPLAVVKLEAALP